MVALKNFKPIQLSLYSKGFSLIETLAVVAILVILTSFITNFSANYNNLNVSSSAEEFADKLRVARSYAMMTGHNASICASNNLKTCNSNKFSDGIVIGFADSQGFNKLYANYSEKYISISGADRVDFSPSGNIAETITIHFCSALPDQTKGKDIEILTSGLVGVTDVSC